MQQQLPLQLRHKQALPTLLSHSVQHAPGRPSSGQQQRQQQQRGQASSCRRRPAGGVQGEGGCWGALAYPQLQQQQAVVVVVRRVEGRQVWARADWAPL